MISKSILDSCPAKKRTLDAKCLHAVLMPIFKEVIELPFLCFRDDVSFRRWLHWLRFHVLDALYCDFSRVMRGAISSVVFLNVGGPLGWAREWNS
jgi:hypothetical protein